MRPEVVPLLDHASRLEILEVGGGTGSFAAAFIKQAASLIDVDYHILDLSPALMKNQREVLAELLPESRHFQQDATEFDLPGQSFDLIISNEVIADFPVAPVERNTRQARGRERVLTTWTNIISRTRARRIRSSLTRAFFALSNVHGNI